MEVKLVIYIKSYSHETPPFSYTSISQTRLPPRLKRQKHRKQSRSNEQRARNIHRCRSVEIGIDSYNGRNDPKHPIRRGRQRVAGPSILCREDLRRVGVEDGVHDIAHEAVRAVPPQQLVGRQSRRRCEQEHARQSGGDGQGAFSPEARDLDQHPTDRGAGDAQDGDDERVAVCDVG